jgi:hypothetical protein
MTYNLAQLFQGSQKGWFTTIYTPTIPKYNAE